MSGTITKETPEELKRKIAKTERDMLVFESPGGNLKAALDMGRIIRSSGFRTRVGRYFEIENPESFQDQCLSACAYAFLGGTKPEMGGNTELGFHRFSLSGDNNTLVAVGKALRIAQNLSSLLVGYIIEMGVEARIFNDASSTPSNQMYVPTRKKLLDYEILTPEKFSRFYLDPYGDGVVATSKRQHAVNRFDNLDQLTIYCIRGEPRLLFTTSIISLATGLPELLNLKIHGSKIFKARIAASNIVMRGTIRKTMTEAAKKLHCFQKRY